MVEPDQGGGSRAATVNLLAFSAASLQGLAENHKT